MAHDLAWEFDKMPLEMLLPCVLDATDTDPLLEKLRAVHGEPRFDIAPELIAATRRTASKGASKAGGCCGFGSCTGTMHNGDRLATDPAVEVRCLRFGVGRLVPSRTAVGRVRLTRLAPAGRASISRPFGVSAVRSPSRHRRERRTCRAVLRRPRQPAERSSPPRCLRSCGRLPSWRWRRVLPPPQ